MSDTFDLTCTIPQEHRTVFENYIALEAAALNVSCILMAKDGHTKATFHIHAEANTRMAVERFRSRVMSRSIVLSGR